MNIDNMITAEEDTLFEIEMKRRAMILLGEAVSILIQNLTDNDDDRSLSEEDIFFDALATSELDHIIQVYDDLLQGKDSPNGSFHINFVKDPEKKYFVKFMTGRMISYEEDEYTDNLPYLVLNIAHPLLELFDGLFGESILPPEPPEELLVEVDSVFRMLSEFAYGSERHVSRKDLYDLFGDNKNQTA